MNKYLVLFFFPIVFFGQNLKRSLSSENWKFKQVDTKNWFTATVPGTVHTDLLANNVIPDPFLETNEKNVQWVEKKDWEYKTSFFLSQSEMNFKNIDLQFDGLDTYASVFLNNQLILEANNMFRIWKIPVRKYLLEGENILKVVFKSAVIEEQHIAKKQSVQLPTDERVYSRKAPYQYGWDWGPRLVTAGIWKDVKLHFWNQLTLVNSSYKQVQLDSQKADLEFNTTVFSEKKQVITIKVNDSIAKVELQKGLHKIPIKYRINNPKLWWCNGLGEPNLYAFKISLFDDLQEIESQEMNIGLRTIELIQEQDAIGKSFYFKLNGKPVFMKGANYIPEDSFLPRVADSVSQKRIEDAVAANMNMLRVWGGGVYASDAFYNACDKNGILVWQDFMFACAMYPGGKDFLENIKQEVIDNVNRIQNHPSLALWCGNNEIDEAWHNWGWQKQLKYSKADSTQIWKDYQKVFHELLPNTLDSLYPEKKAIYWPSSPSIGWGRKESLLQGDAHYWGVWWGKEPFEIYEEKVGRFMSEYGFQGMPDMTTFNYFSNGNQLEFDSESIKSHQKHPTGYETIKEYMQRDYIIPKTFENYSYVSQLLQAKGMKVAIEAHRRAKPNCMGTLYWQLNDCWPVTSWSSVDYFGNWKASHYQVKQSFENLLISVGEDKEKYQVYLVNDSLQDILGNLILKTIDFNGKVLFEKTILTEVKANSSQIVYTFSKKDIPKKYRKKSVVQLQFVTKEKKVNTTFYWVKPKDLQLLKPGLKITKIDEVTYEITSNVVAKNVCLSSDEKTHFSHNYFDVLPNEVYTIKVTQPVKTVSVKSLFDTLN
ncbi:glycoside hydrolase family 2 protein [Flavobacterium sp. NRK F7]|uniref:beta-mannosidase n=1 Tax=Flavobacterium sp. NRK F7 TaxID=2954930 RepID=UPI00209199F7|nr:glycoside hydrolase family 2 protein [Flavobacterium sp. NRK F7]MCO6161302.1 glycoside hydrolase family 2 protein [Flavobacterium sp. NRK F7]